MTIPPRAVSSVTGCLCIVCVCIDIIYTYMYSIHNVKPLFHHVSNRFKQIQAVDRSPSAFFLRPRSYVPRISRAQCPNPSTEGWKSLPGIKREQVSMGGGVVKGLILKGCASLYMSWCIYEMVVLHVKQNMFRAVK